LKPALLHWLLILNYMLLNISQFHLIHLPAASIPSHFQLVLSGFLSVPSHLQSVPSNMIPGLSHMLTFQYY
jgi:hypothetical protein